MEPIVKVNGVSKTYYPSPAWLKLMLRSSIKEPVHALKNVSLEVAGGQIVAVVGPNGAGKSTLFRVLTGLTTPTSGSASILGYDVATQSAAVRRHLGFMPPEERTLWMRHSCAENLIFHGRLQGMGREPEAPGGRRPGDRRTGPRPGPSRLRFVVRYERSAAFGPSPPARAGSGDSG